jgi:vacuolar-type H+-ATPase subunit H
MAVSNFSQAIKNKSNDVKADTACATDEAKGKVQELASSAVQKVQDVAVDVSHKAQDWASNVADKAQETASAAVDKANDGISAVGHQMNALSGTVRKAAPQDGVIGSAATTVADQLQAGGRYLEGHGVQDIGKDLTSLVREYPIQSVLVGFGLGCLLGMTLRRS